MLVYRGQMPADMAVDETIAALPGTFRYPLPYGYAAVGEVEAVGDKAHESWLGKRVFAFQPHQSHFLAEPETLFLLPETMHPETAVFLPNMETAVSLVMDAQPVIGEQVAVLGQGVIGLLVTRLLAQFPLASLVTADLHALRRQQALLWGASHSLAVNQPDFIGQLRTCLQEERPFAGADLVLELSGNPEALNQAIEAVGFNGRIVIGSWYGTKTAHLQLGGPFHRQHVQIITSQVSMLAPHWQGRWSKTRRWQVAERLLTQNPPNALITHRLPLEQAAKAYALLDQQADQALQILFTY